MGAWEARRFKGVRLSAFVNRGKLLSDKDGTPGRKTKKKMVQKTGGEIHNLIKRIVIMEMVKIMKMSMSRRRRTRKKKRKRTRDRKRVIKMISLKVIMMISTIIMTRKRHGDNSTAISTNNNSRSPASRSTDTQRRR